MANKFEYLTRLPIPKGEAITAMTVWEALGKQCIVVATRDQMFILRIAPTGRMDWAGPLEFVEAPETSVKVD